MSTLYILNRMEANRRWLEEVISVTNFKQIDDQLALLLACERPSFKAVRKRLLSIVDDYAGSTSATPVPSDDDQSIERYNAHMAEGLLNQYADIVARCTVPRMNESDLREQLAAS